MQCDIDIAVGGHRDVARRTDPVHRQNAQNPDGSFRPPLSGSQAGGPAASANPAARHTPATHFIHNAIQCSSVLNIPEGQSAMCEQTDSFPGCLRISASRVALQEPARFCDAGKSTCLREKISR